MGVGAILGGLTAGGLALAPWLMRTLPGLVARGSGPLARKKLLEKAGRAVSPLHGGKLARGAKSGAYGLGTAYGVDAMFGGQAAPEVGDVQGTLPPTVDRNLNSPWNPSDGLMDSRDAKRMRSETFWGNMNKMMEMSAILNATDGDTEGFQKMMGMANKKVLSDMDDQRLMDQYDSVFQQGNMPNTAIEAYERMIASKAGPEAAAKVAGQYVKMRSVKLSSGDDKTDLIARVNTYLQANNIQAAVAAVKQAIGMKIIPTDAYKNELGNMLSGQELDNRIREMLSVVASGTGVQEAG
jgi:hypothetical protein